VTHATTAHAVPDDAGAHPFTLAIDAMGGDHAPGVIVEGVALAADRHPGARFLLVGDQPRIDALLASNKRARAVCTVRHAPDVVANDAKPAAALRLKQSSLRVAIDTVAAGSAHGVISAGNTGAMLAMAKIVIKTLPGIDRPAMAAIMPSARGDVVMLDLGANLACDPRNLVEFALLGDMFARTVLGLTAPSIGLLNVGSEELKGDERIRQAADILRRSHIASQFHGFVEGHDIAAGTTDIVVTDGFTGNVALKTGEGALKLVSDLLRQIFSSSLSSKLGYLLARPGLDQMRVWLDPRRYNGAVFLGLNGMVVKSHGGTDAEGFAHALDVGIDMVTHRFNERLRDGLCLLGNAMPGSGTAQPGNGPAPLAAATMTLAADNTAPANSPQLGPNLAAAR
jgi:glycerol-3-phosphate acyltransferase PlsX